MANYTSRHLGFQVKDKQAPLQSYTRRSHTTANGDYRVSVTDTNGCTGLYADYSVNALGIADNSVHFNNIRFYPNPTTTTLTIAASNKITTIIICNLIGQTLSTYKYNSNEVQIDVAGLPAEIYFVKINGTEVKRFVKQ